MKLSLAYTKIEALEAAAARVAGDSADMRRRDIVRSPLDHRKAPPATW